MTAEPGRHATRCRTVPSFRCGGGLSPGAIPARPALLIHVLTAKRCLLATRPSTENLIILARPMPAGSGKAPTPNHRCCHGTGGRQRHSLRRAPVTELPQ